METRLSQVVVPEVRKTREAMECAAKESSHIRSLCHQIDVAEEHWDSYSILFGELKKKRELLEEMYSAENSEKLEYSESKQMKLFEHLLGFEMKRNEDGTVNFEFSNLTSNEPHLTCSVKMDVNSQNQWEVLDAVPPIEGVASLLEELNKTKNIAVFCKNIRRAFKNTFTQQ